MEDYQHIYDEFAYSYKMLADNAVEYLPNGPLEILIILNDGTQLYYDYMIKTVTFVDPRKERTFQSEFSRRLDKRMMVKGITHQYLSEVTGISRQTLSKYSNGQSLPTLANLFLIAKALNCPMSELIDIDYELR